MMTKEEYKREVVRMFNSLRDDRLKEDDDCSGVQCCEECALYGIDCGNSTKAFEMIEAVEKWAKENPPKKFKVSRMEYDMLQIYAINHISNNDTFNDFCTLRGLLDKGYFEGATGSMHIGEYYINCEVKEDDRQGNV